MPPEQFPETQSVPTLQSLPLAQGGHVPPPQSTSVSVPFLMLSVQVGTGTEAKLAQGFELTKPAPGLARI